MAAKLSRAEVRRLSRTGALQLLYYLDGVRPGDSEWERLTEWFWEGFWTVPEREQVRALQREEAEAYARRLVLGVFSFNGDVENAISEASENWGIERMGRVDRNVLRLAVYEILKEEDVPERVSINEAIELAKIFGTERSGGFVNGLLDRIAKGRA